MSNNFERCLGCMQTKAEGIDVCPNCGYASSTPPKEAYHINPGTILKARYVIGKVVGFGGFGVTYISWDLVLQQRVAVKEYFPGDFATRIPGTTDVKSFDGESSQQYEAGLSRFMSEARSLAKFAGTEGIVSIFDTFYENSTAYIVMEFLEGQDLKAYLKQNGGTLDYAEASRIIAPVLSALKLVHKENLIHRDISPDNIFMTVDGNVKLIDFGAARYATTTHSKSLSVILKPGYAPEEQYRSRGKQGPWSDVYAIAATLYRVLTGIVPEESMERKVNDKVKDPTKLNSNIPKHAEIAIMNALVIDMDYRTQSIDDFEKELLGEVDASRTRIKKSKVDTGRWPLWLKIQVPIAALLIIAVVVLGALGVFKSEDPTPPPAPDMVKVPSLFKMQKEDAEQTLSDLNLRYTQVDSEFSTYAPINTIMLQTPMQGNKAQAGITTIEVVVSAGPDYAEIPDLTYRNGDEAVKELEEMGFLVVIEEESKDIAPGAVYALLDRENTAIEPGLHEKGQKLILKISTGFEGGSVGEPVTVPDLTGKDFEDGKNELKEISLYIIKEKEEWSEEVPAGQILSQNVKKETESVTGNVIGVTISKGKKQVIVPYVESKPEKEAVELLEELGFENITIEHEANKNVLEGNVISQSREANSKVFIYDENDITLVISTGAPWSDKWVLESELPDEVKNNPDAYELKTETQYRYKDQQYNPGSWTKWYSTEQSGDWCGTKTSYNISLKEYTTATSTSLSGWERTGDIIWSGTWSTWSKTAVTATELRQVQTRPHYITQYQYQRWRFKTTSGTYTYSPVKEYPEPWRDYTHHYTPWLNSQLTKTGTVATSYYGVWNKYSYNGNTYYGETKTAPATRQYNDYDEYSYQNGEYEYWRWGTPSAWVEGTPPASTSDKKVTVRYSYQKKNYYWPDNWSKWQFDKVTSTKTRKVETREVVQYREKQN